MHHRPVREARPIEYRWCCLTSPAPGASRTIPVSPCGRSPRRRPLSSRFTDFGVLAGPGVSGPGTAQTVETVELHQGAAGRIGFIPRSSDTTPREPGGVGLFVGDDDVVLVESLDGSGRSGVVPNKRVRTCRRCTAYRSAGAIRVPVDDALVLAAVLAMRLGVEGWTRSRRRLAWKSISRRAGRCVGRFPRWKSRVSLMVVCDAQGASLRA